RLTRPAVNRKNPYRPTRTLAGVQVAVQLKVGYHIVVRIEVIEKGLSGRSYFPGLLFAGPYDDRRAAIILHYGQSFQRDQMLELGDLVAVEIDRTGERPERRIRYNRVHFHVRRPFSRVVGGGLVA